MSEQPVTGWRTQIFTFIACVLAGAAGAVAVQLVEAATR
jgi:hypothetical protein